MLAKNKEAARNLTNQFQSGAVAKTYLCICDRDSNHPIAVDTAFDIDLPIQRSTDPLAPKFARECGNSLEDSKPAKTRFTILSYTDHSALLQAEPLSGRTHQIRLHAAAAEYSIVGDNVYGREKVLFKTTEELQQAADDPDKERFLYDDRLRCGLKLHASTLSFNHPRTQEPVTFSAPVLSHFAKYAQQQDLTIPESYR